MFRIKNINFGTLLLVSGLLCQIIVYIITNDTLLSLISGVAGIFSVVLCSERKMSYYLWSFIQIFTFTIICYNEGLYAKLIENAFYVITMLYGIYNWKINKDIDNKIKTKSCTKTEIFIFLTMFVVCYWVLFFILFYNGGNTPIFDSLTTSLAIIAQIMMILRYTENWIVWCIMNILCCILFAIIGNWCMVVQYIFWTINTLYGYNIWKKSAMA